MILKKIFTVIGNIIWMCSCSLDYCAFIIASRNIRKTQQKLLKSIIKKNAATQFGQSHSFTDEYDKFSNMPIQEYEAYRPWIERISAGEQNVLTQESVELFEPTSGSTTPTKLIPYTRSLKKEFLKAVNPWIFDLFLRNPTLLFGQHYWSISPSTPFTQNGASKIPIGFHSDDEYLGTIQRKICRILFAVPPDLSKIQDMETFQYLTLLYLLNNQNLRLISIWHPSFFLVLLDRLKHFKGNLIKQIRQGDWCHGNVTIHQKPAPKRASVLNDINFDDEKEYAKIWPKLRIISTWNDGVASLDAKRLASIFPKAKLQPKGLLATEGVISFPIGSKSQRPLAIRSHYYEFQEKVGHSIRQSWELSKGKVYSVIITTGGGLYRYPLHDQIKITGFFGQIPCIAFLSKETLVSDCVGEKISHPHIVEVFESLKQRFGSFYSFAMLAPCIENGVYGYALFIEQVFNKTWAPRDVRNFIENQLCQNYHYLNARSIGQLSLLRIFIIETGGKDAYIQYFIRKGLKAGDIKLYELRPEIGWEYIFHGKFI